MRAGAAGARRHVHYIEREGVEPDGSPGRIYGADDSGDPRRSLLEEQPQEHHQFRFIISPESTRGLDLESFVRRLVAEVERDIGAKLIWGAVNHHDTDQAHAHLVVRGIDRKGEEVRFERRYISESMRARAQHLLTEELGPRQAHELDRQALRERTQTRFTKLDRELSRLLTAGDAVLSVKSLAALAASRREHLLARLATLSDLQLVAQPVPGSWRFAAGWQESLRDLGERGDVLKRIHRAMGGQGDPSRYGIFDGSGNQGAPLVGVVRSKGLHNEETGEGYAVVESENGRAHYVRLDDRDFDGLQEGAVVRVDAKAERWLKPMDRALYESARARSGVYDARAHLAELSARGPSIRGERVDANEIIAANIRRLERLGKFGLATRIDSGRWNIPADFLTQLADRERTHPRVSAQVSLLATSLAADVRSRARAWLDTQSKGTGAGRAHFGFGAELSAAELERAAFLRDIGGIGVNVSPGGQPDRRELDAIAARLARSTGCETLTALPSSTSFTGRVFACERAPSGTELVRVVDDQGRRALLLPRADRDGLLPGQRVKVSRDANGRMLVVAIDRGDEA